MRTFSTCVMLHFNYPTIQRFRNEPTKMSALHLDEAQRDISSAVELNPLGYYDVIWLYIARAKAGAKGEHALAKNAAALNMTKWPAPVKAVPFRTRDTHHAEHVQHHCRAQAHAANQIVLHWRFWKVSINDYLAKIAAFASAIRCGN
jgi:hypothetical protein